MTIYLLRLPNHEQLFPWDIGDRDARRYDIPDPKNHRGCYYEADPNEDIWSALKRQTTWFVGSSMPFEKVTLAPGQCYPRIARPASNHPDGNNLLHPFDQNLKNEIAIAEGQLRVLLRLLHRICQAVHPYRENLNVYGHDIRNLLILACTEVESHWRAVLVANGFYRERYSTNDYVKLVARLLGKQLKPFLKCQHCQSRIRLTRSNARQMYLREQLTCIACQLTSAFPFYWLLGEAKMTIERSNGVSAILDEQTSTLPSSGVPRDERPGND